MLLVKSKESKNLNKNNSPSSVLAGLSCILLVNVAAPLYAATDSQSITSASSILNVFLSLLVVVAIIFALAFIMRRFNVAQAGGGQMRVVASMMAGAKEKVMVIEVGDEQHLLGITAHSINHLAKLENPIQKEANVSASHSVFNREQNGKANFHQKLVNAMAHSIAGSKTNKRANKKSEKGAEHV
jgi:flagellar protein FliO/FliZ